MRVFESPAALLDAIGETLGPSAWCTVDQARIDLFADATGDHQWIHVDPARAAAGPFGSTIAHGYLTLSLLATLLPQLFDVRATSMAVNYGLNSVRFPTVVPAGARLRASAVVLGAESVTAGIQLTLAARIEVDGQSKPACAAEIVIRYIP